MHEKHIVVDLFNAAVASAKQHSAAHVTDVYLRLGPLSSVKPDSVQFYWDMLSPGTVCQGARLHFDPLPATAKCLDCGHDFTVEGATEACPACGGVRLQLRGGNEIEIESLDID